MRLTDKDVGKWFECENGQEFLFLEVCPNEQHLCFSPRSKQIQVVTLVKHYTPPRSLKEVALAMAVELQNSKRQFKYEEDENMADYQDEIIAIDEILLELTEVLKKESSNGNQS